MNHISFLFLALKVSFWAFPLILESYSFIFLSLNYIVNGTLICIFYFFMSTSAWYLSTTFLEMRYSTVKVVQDLGNGQLLHKSISNCRQPMLTVMRMAAPLAWLSFARYASLHSVALFETVSLSVLLFIWKGSHVLCRESCPPMFPLLYDRMQRTLLA